jgi:cation diffusion facilitator CzcD-associated flavoprotein CzcO
MVAQENNFVEKYIKLRHKIVRATWTDEASKWTVTVQNLETGQEFEDQVDIIIDGGGVLNRWKWPDIEGLNDFTGDLLHSANWNQGCDLTNKRVALIGAGSSGVQILPNIYDRVSKVYTWVRNRIWITAGFAQAFAGKDGANFIYTDEQRKLFSDPDSYLTYRKAIEGELNRRFEFIINGSQAQKDAREFSENEMKTLLKKRPDLLDKIMPTNFDVGCRRRELQSFPDIPKPLAEPSTATPGNGYLEALISPKTTAYTEQIRRITKTGFIDPDGIEHQVDVIICATGFDTTYNLKFPVYVNGLDMNEKWQSRDKVPSYLSLGYAEVRFGWTLIPK